MWRTLPPPAWCPEWHPYFPWEMLFFLFKAPPPGQHRGVFVAKEMRMVCGEWPPRCPQKAMKGLLRGSVCLAGSPAPLPPGLLCVKQVGTTSSMHCYPPPFVPLGNASLRRLLSLQLQEPSRGWQRSARRLHSVRLRLLTAPQAMGRKGPRLPPQARPLTHHRAPPKQKHCCPHPRENTLKAAASAVVGVGWGGNCI